MRSFVYDAAGNMTRDTRGTTQYNYTISAAGRIARVAIGTSVRADYVYDGQSRLVSRVTQNQVGAGTVRYVHDNENRIIAELNATGTTIREYVWLEDLPIAVLDGSTNTANPSLFFVHADHLNRPVAMSNASRDWVWRAQYEPFGAVHQIVGAAANDNRFPGQMFQLEAGLAYNWHRHYDASLGRYTQPDPLGLQTLLSDGPSVYGYAWQSPLMWVDPFGLEAVGHHYVPNGVTNSIPNLSSDAANVFRKFTTGPLSRPNPNTWGTEHIRYNEAVKKEFYRFCESNSIDPSKMTSRQAEQFARQIRFNGFKNPDIYNFNNRIHSHILNNAVRRSPGGGRGPE